jgi:protein-disulfide isomerase
MDAYPGQVRVVYKHFPLAMHRQARPAAEAAIFAMEHDKFWEMHEMIFKNYRQLSIEKFQELARSIGLDENDIQESITRQAFKAAIDRDVADGRKAGVTGTPTIFVNGKRLRRRDFATFKRMIDEALNANAGASAGAGR